MAYSLNTVTENEIFLHLHNNWRSASDFPYSLPEAVGLPSASSALFWVPESLLFLGHSGQYWGISIKSPLLSVPPQPHSSKQATEKHKQAWAEVPARFPHTEPQVEDMPYTLIPLKRKSCPFLGSYFPPITEDSVFVPATDLLDALQMLSLDISLLCSTCQPI